MHSLQRFSIFPLGGSYYICYDVESMTNGQKVKNSKTKTTKERKVKEENKKEWKVETKLLKKGDFPRSKSFSAFCLLNKHCFWQLLTFATY